MQGWGGITRWGQDREHCSLVCNTGPLLPPTELGPVPESRKPSSATAIRGAIWTRIPKTETVPAPLQGSGPPWMGVIGHHAEQSRLAKPVGIYKVALRPLQWISPSFSYLFNLLYSESSLRFYTDLPNPPVPLLSPTEAGPAPTPESRSQLLQYQELPRPVPRTPNPYRPRYSGSAGSPYMPNCVDS